MLNSTVLEVAIGLVFCYASVALISSSVYEAMASLLKLRATSLLDGIKGMLNDKQFVGLAKDLYNHALVNPRDSGNVTSEKELSFKPSYIAPGYFAIALVDSIQKAPSTFDDLGKKIDAIGDAQLRTLLKGMYERADGKVENLHAALAAWFDSAMARVSGAYKRKAQLFSFIAAFSLSALLNIDTFHLFHSLWSHPALVAQLGTSNAQTAAQALDALQGLPVGWSSSPWSIVACFGWLVTASSALFGAPFWFNLLQRVANLRGTGPKPDERKT